MRAAVRSVKALRFSFVVYIRVWLLDLGYVYHQSVCICTRSAYSKQGMCPSAWTPLLRLGTAYSYNL